MVEVEVRRGQVQLQEILPPGQVQGRGHDRLTFALFQDVGDVFTTVIRFSKAGAAGEGKVVETGALQVTPPSVECAV